MVLASGRGGGTGQAGGCRGVRVRELTGHQETLSQGSKNRGRMKARSPQEPSQPRYSKTHPGLGTKVGIQGAWDGPSQSPPKLSFFLLKQQELQSALQGLQPHPPPPWPSSVWRDCAPSLQWDPQSRCSQNKDRFPKPPQTVHGPLPCAPGLLVCCLLGQACKAFSPYLGWITPQCPHPFYTVPYTI